MKRSFSFLIVLVLFAGNITLAENHAKPMTDDDVIAMVKAGLPDDTIISAINGQATDFDVSAMALVNLKNQGVSVKVIDTMLAASKKQHDAPSSSTPAPASAPSAAQSPQGEQFVSSGTPSQPAGSNPQGGAPNSTAPAAGNAQNSGQPAQKTGFFDKLNQTQNQITGTIQQGQSNYQQVRGGTPGHPQNNAAGQAPGAYPGAPATNGQPAATGAYPPASNPPAANPGAANQAAAQARYQQQLRQQQQQRGAAAQQAAVQQQRQQQAAANQQRQQLTPAQRQQRAAAVRACMQQAAKAHPQGGPDLAKAYTSCMQAP